MCMCMCMSNCDVCCYCLNSICVSIGLIMCVVLVKYRDSNAVKSGSFLFTLLVVISCMLLISSIGFFAVPPEASICRGRWIYPALAFTLLISCMFAKIYRIYKIFANDKVRIVILKDIHLAGISLGLLMITSIILAIMMTVEEPHVKTVGN